MPFYEDSRQDRAWNTGDRGFSHYTNPMEYGTVIEGQKDPEAREDWDSWFRVRMDSGNTELLNAERFVPEAVAIRFGYGPDPKSAEPEPVPFPTDAVDPR